VAAAVREDAPTRDKTRENVPIALRYDVTLFISDLVGRVNIVTYRYWPVFVTLNIV
jgi:hypothetical protein